MITEGNKKCRQHKLSSMPNHERKFYHPDNCDNDLRRDIRAMGMDNLRSMGSAQKWRCGGRDHFWMFLVSLSSLVLFFESRRSTNGVSIGFTTFGVSQVEVEFPHAPDLAKGRPEWY
jgi:hypothetical protein